MLLNEIFADQPPNLVRSLIEAPGTSPAKRRLALANMQAGKDLHVGDEVIVTGPVKYQGSTGVIDELGRQNMFAVVNLYNHGRVSFQASDLEINDYADSDEERGVAEGSVTKKPQPYNELNWVKKLPKEKLDAIAGPKYKKDKKEQGVAEK